MKMNIPENTDAYIASFPPEVRERLEAMRATVRRAAPDAEERISYGMPALFQDGVIVYYAAFARHIGFYATPTGNAAFAKELESYKTGNGSIQFQFDRALPLKLIERMTAFRLAENREKAKRKSATRSAFAALSQPAQRALASAGIKSVKGLSKYTEKEILALHGMGKASLPVLLELLSKAKLTFKK